MLYQKTKMITEWIGGLLNEYADYTKQDSRHRCKISGIETDKKTDKDKILVKVNSVKSQIPIAYYPEELVCNDSMLREFSQTDVRAITFYAFKNAQKKENNTLSNRYKITSQEFINNKTIFTYKEINTEGEFRISADELYSETSILKQFYFDDIRNIIHAAVQEQTIDDVV